MSPGNSAAVEDACICKEAHSLPWTSLSQHRHRCLEADCMLFQCLGRGKEEANSLPREPKERGNDGFRGGSGSRVLGGSSVCRSLQPSPAPPHPSPLPSDREKCVTDPPLYHWILFISPRTRNPQDFKALVSSSLCRLGLTASHRCPEDTTRPTTLAFSKPPLLARLIGQTRTSSLDEFVPD